MARIRVIGKKEAPVAKRYTVGQKLYSGLKSIGQKVVDNRYAIGSLFAAAAAAAAAAPKPNMTDKNNNSSFPIDHVSFPRVPSHSQLTPPTSYKYN